MKAGARVKYVAAGGDEHVAHVTEVTGTGDSLYKIVSLVYGDGVHVHDVAHENDVADGEAHWRETGAARRLKMVPTAAVPGGGVPSGVAFVIPPEREEEDAEPEAEPEPEPAAKRKK